MGDRKKTAVKKSRKAPLKKRTMLDNKHPKGGTWGAVLANGPVPPMPNLGVPSTTEPKTPRGWGVLRKERLTEANAPSPASAPEPERGEKPSEANDDEECNNCGSEDGIHFKCSNCDMALCSKCDLGPEALCPGCEEPVNVPEDRTPADPG